MAPARETAEVSSLTCYTDRGRGVRKEGIEVTLMYDKRIESALEP